MRIARLLVLLTAAASLGAVPSPAQAPAPLKQPDAIPYDLASALMSAGTVGYDPQIMVAGMPEWVSNSIVMPSGAHVLGSAFVGSTAVAILVLPPDADSVIPDMRREMFKRGWKNPPPPQTGQSGGFRPASMGNTNTDARRMTLCDDQHMLTASSARRRGMVTEVTVRISTVTPTGYSTCRPFIPSAMVMAQQGTNRAAMPVLYNPSGASETGGMMEDCISPRFSAANTYANLRTSMAPQALLDHYARQLQDSGWKPMPTQPQAISRSWVRPDSAGTLLETMLTVSVSAQRAQCSEITMTTLPVKK
jgi:hypothetical protein